MDKLSTTIVGTCVSREMFNDYRIQDSFNVEFYAFKVCPWAIFQEGLGIPKNVIYRLPISEYLNRNIDYEFNKNLVSHLEEHKTDYIVFDFFTFKDRLFEICYNGKKIYAQTNSLFEYIGKLKKICDGAGYGISYREINFDEVPEEVIADGFIKLAKYADDNYQNIVLVIPQVADKYFSSKNTIEDFNQESSKVYLKAQSYVNKWSEFFASQLAEKIKVLRWPADTIARLIDVDYQWMDNLKFSPNAVHLITRDREKIAQDFLDLVGVDYKQYYNRPLEFSSYNIETIKNDLTKREWFMKKLNNQAICTINGYTNYLKKCKHHLIIFSVMQDGEHRIKYWLNRFSLGLEMKIGFKDSYIAVVDTKNHFAYEKASQDYLVYRYEIPNTNLHIVAESCAGGGNKIISSVWYKGKQYSKRKRGFNIVVIDLNTFNIEDCANCDTSMDEFLLVESNRLNIFNS